MSETIYMPDGRPAPFVMSAEQAAQFLGLENGDPKKTLARYRREGRLRGTQVGDLVRYTLPELVKFLTRQTESVPR